MGVGSHDDRTNSCQLTQPHLRPSLMRVSGSVTSQGWDHVNSDSDFGRRHRGVFSVVVQLRPHLNPGEFVTLSCHAMTPSLIAKGTDRLCAPTMDDPDAG